MSGKKEVTVKRLEKEIAKILNGADLKTTSTKKVRLELEKTFADVNSWAKKIDEIVMEHVENMDDPEDEEEVGISSEEVGISSEEEEEEKPKAKEEVDLKPLFLQEEEEKPKAKEEVDLKPKDESEPEDDDSEEEVKKKPAAKKPNTRKRKSSADDNDYKPKKSAKAKKAGGGGGKSNGYTKAYKLSPALSSLMGEAEMPRHEVVRRVWAMIKEKNLYDPNNKQFAICDEALYAVIGVKKFRTFGMMKYLKNHFIT